MDRKKVLLIAHNLDDFVGQDLEIIKTMYEVDTLTADNILKLIFNIPRFFYKIFKSDLVFIWFASSYATLATILCKILGKKSIIVAGGHDTAKILELDYGLLARPITGYFPKIAIKLADKLLMISKASELEMKSNFAVFGKSEIVHLGVDKKKYDLQRGIEKHKTVITVGEIKSDNIRRKGYDTLVKVAGNLPAVNFIFVGKIMDLAGESLKAEAPENVKFTGFLDFDKLKEELQKSKVYAQLSAHEGFGFALAEGMLMECVPVVTNRGSLPEVVGDTGFVVEYGVVEEATEAIKKALQSGKGKDARKRIMKKFPLEMRKRKLLKAIEELI